MSLPPCRDGAAIIITDGRESVQTYGRILPPEEVVAGIAAVTADDVLAIANEILDDSKRSVSWVTPKN